MYKKYKNCKLLTFRVLTYADKDTEEMKDVSAFTCHFRLAVHIMIFNVLAWSCKYKIKRTSIFDIKIYCEGLSEFDNV
jgi:hypothetical protein